MEKMRPYLIKFTELEHKLIKKYAKLERKTMIQYILSRLFNYDQEKKGDEE